MRNLTMMILLSLTLTGLALTTASGDDKVGCDEIQWTQALLADFADIDKACQEIVVRDGNRYVHFEVKLIRTLKDGNVKVLMTLRDGHRVENIVKVPSNFQVQSYSGKTTFHMNQLKPGDILDVYIPEHRITTAGLGREAD